MADWPIQEVSRVTGVTSRTLRHYDAIGLLPPTFTGHGGVRYYDDAALVRLQRILLLRDLGLGLATIATTLAAAQTEESETAALHTHLDLLRDERAALDRRIAAVRRTIQARENGDAMTKDMFDGFDHAQFEEEVTQRWGRAAWQESNDWWESKTEAERADLQAVVRELNAAWVAAASEGADPRGERAQEIAARHVAWLRSVPGTPGGTDDPEQFAQYLTGLGEMYVADDRFRANYSDPVQGVADGPELVRDALAAWVELNLR